MALPLAFDYGLYQVLMAAKVGATVILEKSFAFPARALEIMARERVTVFPGVPTMFTALLAHPEIGKYDLSSLKYCGSGGAPLPLEVAQRFQPATLKRFDPALGDLVNRNRV